MSLSQPQLFERNFTVFENEIWDIADEFKLSNGAIVLFMKIKTMAYGKKKTIFPSQLYLSQALRCSVRSIQRYLGELVKAGCLKSLQRHTTSNLYTLLPIKRENLIHLALSTGTTGESYKEETPINTSLVCENIGDDDKTLEIIKVLGDNSIDIDSLRGQEYFKIYHQEKPTLDQLDFALKLVNIKIKKGTIKKSEFGLAVMSIRQNKAGLVVLYPSIQQSKPVKKVKSEVKNKNKELYDSFYA